MAVTERAEAVDDLAVELPDHGPGVPGPRNRHPRATPCSAKGDGKHAHVGHRHEGFSISGATRSFRRSCHQKRANATHRLALARGYIRRTDLDFAQSKSEYSCAAIAFEKPGVPVTVEQPIIFVATRPFSATSTDGTRRTVVGTQVFAGLFADSAGTLVARDTPTDPAYGLKLDTSTQLTTDDLEYRSIYDYQNLDSGPNPYTATWQAIPEEWRNFGINVAAWGAAGYLGGGGNPVVAAAGAVAGAITYFYPRPCNCP